MAAQPASALPSQGGLSPVEAWGYALAAALVIAVAVEELPMVGVPLAALIIAVMLVSWKGWSS